MEPLYQQQHHFVGLQLVNVTGNIRVYIGRPTTDKQLPEIQVKITIK